MSVAFFLAAVGFYLYRDRVPYSALLGGISAILTVVFLSVPTLSPLAALPGAYLTIWLGLMSPPRIPFGDLSYGVYLFHYPIEQSMVQLFPQMHLWWQVTAISLPPSLLCAFMSWNLIEHPILKQKWQVLGWIDQRAAAVLAFQRRLVQGSTS